MLRKFVRQLRPTQEKYVAPVLKIQNFFESYSFYPKSEKEIKNTLSDFPSENVQDILKLFTFLKSKDKTPINIDLKIPNKINVSRDLNDFYNIDDIKTGASLNTIKIKFGNGSGNTGKEAPKPKGADWESLITHQYNNILGNEKADTAAFEQAQKFYPKYAESATLTAKSFTKFAKTTMIQYGGGGGKKNLSSFWIERGGTNGTPKTDMYTKQYNISLKKKGGSQLASGGTGETISSFYAALEYMGVDRNAKKDIDKIMKQIEDNFAKIKNKDLTAGLAKKISTGEKKVDLTPKLKKDIQLFTTTEKFHKELNKEIIDILSFEKNPLFREWYCFEVMSGYKKFSNKQSVASVCIEFDPNNGQITKFIPVTSDGKNDGLSGDTPKISKEVKDISSKMKIFSAWKTGDGSPASVLRVIPSSYTPHENEYPLTFSNIIQDELRNDIVANKVISNLNEEFEQLDEIAIIGKIFNKLKNLTSKAKSWLTQLLKKIIEKVRQALEKIKEMGTKLFENLFKFFNIEIQSVKETFPSDIHGFVYGMVD